MSWLLLWQNWHYARQEYGSGEADVSHKSSNLFRVRLEHLLISLMQILPMHCGILPWEMSITISCQGLEAESVEGPGGFWHAWRWQPGRRTAQISGRTSCQRSESVLAAEASEGCSLWPAWEYKWCELHHAMSLNTWALDRRLNFTSANALLTLHTLVQIPEENHAQNLIERLSLPKNWQYY